MKLRVRHVVVGLWVFFWLFIVCWRIYWWLGLTFVALFAPLYWQVYVTMKEELDALRERAGVPGKPTKDKAADPQRNQPERS